MTKERMGSGVQLCPGFLPWHNPRAHDFAFERLPDSLVDVLEPEFVRDELIEGVLFPGPDEELEHFRQHPWLVIRGAGDGESLVHDFLHVDLRVQSTGHEAHREVALLPPRDDIIFTPARAWRARPCPRATVSTEEPAHLIPFD